MMTLTARIIVAAICCMGLIMDSLWPALCRATSEPIVYTATVHPLAEIVRHVVQGRARVVTLLPPGGSPHTFEPIPSMVFDTENSRALFFVGPGLDAHWVAKLPANHRVEVINLVPVGMRLPMLDQHEPHQRQPIGETGASDDTMAVAQGETMTDPHFWTDPMTVRGMLPGLVAKLCQVDPDGCQIYHANARAWGANLTQLDQELGELLRPLQSMPLLLFHPSFQYLLQRHQLKTIGLIEPIPGREPTPKALHRLIGQIRATKIRILFSETQLSDRAAMVLAEAASTGETPIKVVALDPLGGAAGRESYRDLMLFNARLLLRAVNR